MRLQSHGQIIEAGLVGYLRGEKTSWEIIYLVRYAIPRRMLGLVRSSIGRRITSIMTKNKRVQLDHGAVVVQHCHRRLSRDLARERRDVAYPSRHGPGRRSTRVRDMGGRNTIEMDGQVEAARSAKAACAFAPEPRLRESSYLIEYVFEP